MDILAKSGLSFTHTYSANQLCMPPRNSMFTGRYPHKTKVTQTGQCQT
jgi:arylsulfatase A-like enzyme